MRRNKDQVEGVVRLAKCVGAGSVKFNPVQPTARGDRMHQAMETLSVAELIELGRRVLHEIAPSTDLPMYFTQPAAFQPLGKMLGEKGGGCGVCGIKNILGVLADGSYSLCGIGESVPELVFGHSSIDSLEDVWMNSEVLKALREGLPEKLEGICSECLVKKACNGSCVAQNYYRSKSLWAPFWFCEEAEKANLFPATRRLKVNHYEACC